MLTDRAAEIISSFQNVEVLYQGKPVWIEIVDKQKEMAHIKILGEERFLDVPVSQLNENGAYES